MSERYEIAKTSEFRADGSRVIAEVDGREIAVFRHDGEFYAVLNYCVHQGGPLCEGPLSGRTVLDDDGWDWVYDGERTNVTCPWHGWMFDIRTGRSIQDDHYAVPTYDVEVEDGRVYVVR